MEITATFDHPGTRVSRIVINVDPADDEIGDLTGLIQRGRLEAFLRLYGGTHAIPADDEDLYHLLAAIGFVGNMIRVKTDHLLLFARDMRGLSWRTLSAQTEIPATTLRERVVAVRRGYAKAGMWYDSLGFHKDDPDRAEQHRLIREGAAD
jgi:hypothetical protein